jgi:hypothetical protein
LLRTTPLRGDPKILISDARLGVVDLCRAGVSGRLERDIAGMPGQVLAPDILGDEGADLAQQRTLPPFGAATWSPRRLARGAPNWMFCVRSLPQPTALPTLWIRR